MSRGRGEDLTRTQIRGSTALLAGQAFALVVNLAVQILIVRYLSKADFGAFAYALSIVMLAETVSAFGLRRGVSRFMPIYDEAGEGAKVVGTLAFGVATILSIGLGVVLLVIAFRGAVAGSFEDQEGAVTVLVIMIALAPVQALGTLLDGVFAVFTRPRAIVLRKFVLSPLMRLAVVLLLAVQDAGVVFLAAGYLAAGLLALALYVPMLARVLRERDLRRYLRPGRLDTPVREVLGFTVPLLTNDVTNALLNAAAPIMLGLLATAGDVASFRAVLPIVLTMGYVLASFGLLFVPLASRLYARGDSGELNRIYWQTATWTTVLAFPIFVGAAVFAEPLVLLLFGERYESSAPVLAILAAGHFVNTAAGHNGVLLGVFARVRFIVAANVVAIATNLALVALLIPPLEAEGAAIATSATFVVLNVARQVGLARRTDVRGVDPHYLPTYGVVVLVTAALFALELALEPPLALGVAAGALGCLAVLAFARRRLQFAETFPELVRLPFVRSLLVPREARP